MNREELLSLRQQIVEGAQALALSGNGTSSDRLQVLMDIIRSGSATKDVYDTTFRLIQEQATDEEKLNSMLDLLFEIDQQIARQESPDGSQVLDSQQPQD